LYCSVLTDWIFYTAMSLLTDCFALEYPYWLIVCTGISLLNAMWCTGIFLLAKCFVLQYPYWINFCTGI
jgi:hypothetical protein